MALDSWQDIAALVGILGVLFTCLGILGTQFYTRRRDSREKRVIKREQQAADDIASDRLIKLAEAVAEKKVAFVRAEFQLIIANLKLDHANELTAMRADFDQQLATIRRDHETYRCDVAPTCKRRHHGQDLAVGGTT
jgi:hypothetical protein